MLSFRGTPLGHLEYPSYHYYNTHSVFQYSPENHHLLCCFVRCFLALSLSSFSLSFGLHASLTIAHLLLDCDT